MTIHRREGEGGRGVNSAGMKKMKTGRYTILNYKVDEPGKGGKIQFFKTASMSDDGVRGGGVKIKYNSLQRRQLPHDPYGKVWGRQKFLPK